MQHISCVQWTLDNKYVISGSDEMCLRLWKAKASEKLGVVSYRWFRSRIFLLYLTLDTKS
jgi:WD repeat and SOF domain-containing protein 1